MPDYRRLYREGGTYFFTLVAAGRASIFCDDLARSLLRSAIEACRQAHSFELDALVLLPDHLHMMLVLPDNDADYSTRVAAIKARFTHSWLASDGAEQSVTGSIAHRRRRGVWQPRFWEHLVRDLDDFRAHLDYIHYNPVKHGLAACPHAWPYSTISKWVRRGAYDPDWQCICDGRTCKPPEFGGLRSAWLEMGE